MSEKFKGTTKSVQDNKPKDSDEKNKTIWADQKEKEEANKNEENCS